METNINPNDQTNKDLMSSWLVYLKGHKQKQEDLENVYSQIRDVLGELLSGDTFSKEDYENEGEKYFITTFSPELIRVILQNREQSLKQEEILKLYLDVLARYPGNPKLLPIFEQCVAVFTDDHLFYKNYEKDGAEVYFDSIYDTLNPNDKTWRSELKTGDFVDYLQKDTDSHFYKYIGIGNWTRAEVLHVDQDNHAIGIRLLIHSTNETTTVSYNSLHIIPYGTLSQDFEWRDEIKVGDEVDFLDNRSWYKSTAMEVYSRMKNGKPVKYIKYGLRVYREDGKLSDSKSRRYYGWSETFDREICAHDSKIRQPNSYSKKIDNYAIISSYPIDSKKFNEIETFVPFIVRDVPVNFVVAKKHESKSLDLIYTRLANYFASQKGFENLTKVMELNFDIFTIVVDILYNVHHYLHYHYAEWFLKDFGQRALEILNSFSKVEIRNFKRDKLESIVRKLKDILNKVYIESDVNAIFDIFGINFGINCLKNSVMLDKKLLGLKVLSDTLYEATKGISASQVSISDRHIPVSVLLGIVMSENTLELVFGSSSHNQILQKSSDLLKSIFIGKVLTMKDIEKLLQMANEDTGSEIKNSIYKGIQVNANHIPNDLNTFIIKQLIQIEADKITTAEIDLILALFKALPMFITKEVAGVVGKFFFDLIFKAQLDEQLATYTLNEYITLMKTWEFRETCISYIEIILKLIGSSNDFIKPLKVLRRILSVLLNILDDHSKHNVLNIVFDQYDLMNQTLVFLQDYHEKAKSGVGYIYSHSEVVTEVISFFNFIAASVCNRIGSFTNEQISLLYKTFVEEAIDPKDSNLFFKFLKEAEDKRMINNDVFRVVFDNMLNSEKIEFNNINFELFNCLWNIFVTINKAKGLLQVSEYKAEQYSNVSSAGNTLISYSYNPDKKTDIEIKVLTSSPFSLIGLDLIWKLILGASQGEVSKRCISSFIKLFINNDLEANKRGEIWKELLDRCIEGIKTAQNELKILNLLGLMKALIEETEKKGTAGCISHSSILKGSVLTLKINNNISHKYSGSKEIKELKLRVFANTTLWDLKCLIGNRLGVIPECIKISINAKDFNDNDHGKTLNELKVKESETINVNKNPILDQIPKYPLIKDGKTSDKAMKAFSEIFENFSTDGRMNREECARFATVAVDSVEQLSVDDPRIRSLFDTYDSDKKGFLVVTDLQQFFRDSIEAYKKITVVWDNLKAFNYRNDLKKLNEPLDEYNNDINIMPRFILSKNQDHFETIFGLQDQGEAVAKEASKLLSVICTNPTIYREILLSNKWENYLDVTNMYKLLYSLQIIESFFEEFELPTFDIDSEPLEMSILDAQDRELLKPDHKLVWIENFLRNGFIYLINNVLLNFDYTAKKCLNLSMKIIKTCLSLLFRARSRKLQKEDIVGLLRSESMTVELDEEKEKPSSIPPVPTNPNMPKDKTEEQIREFENKVIERLNANDDSNIIDQIDFETIVLKLVSISDSVISKVDTTYEERALVHNSILLLSLIFLSQDEIGKFINSVFDKSKLDVFIINGTLDCTNIYIRLVFSKTFKNLCESLWLLKEETFAHRLLEIMINKLKDLNSTQKSQSKYFFQLLEHLLDSVVKSKIYLDIKKISLDIMEILTTQPGLEEELLTGYLKMINIIIQNRSDIKAELGERLIDLLIDGYMIKDIDEYRVSKKISDPYNTLIDPSTDNELKEMLSRKNFYNYESKSTIFTIIVNLITGSKDNLERLLGSKFIGLANYTSKQVKKGYNPTGDRRGMNGYIGLRNPSCVCYMNSMLQQFFNIPTFRYGITQAIDGMAPNFTDQNKEIDDNLLHQLQKMFVFLEYSTRGEYTPLEFCYSFKDWDGQPTNISIQQDCQEFLTRLFDKLEMALRPTQFRYLLQSTFAGRTCVQLFCKGGCGTVRNRFEDLYNLSLDISGVTNIKESLNKFIAEEKIDEYSCDECQRKVSIVKRNSIAELPNVLILHLKRIFFNYDSLSQEKINSRVEFPRQLDMKSYCTEELIKDEAGDEESKEDKEEKPIDEFKATVYEKEDDYYTYELVGVVVHIGIATAGHYYSYINIKRDGEGDTWSFDPEADTNKWLTFNDSTVSQFNFRNLEEECFGGSANADAKDESDAIGFKKSDWENSKNAYMVIYERVKKAPLKLVTEEHSNDVVDITNDNRNAVLSQYRQFEKTSVSLDCENTAVSRRDVYGTIFNDTEKQEMYYYKPFYSMKSQIPYNLYLDVSIDNLLFLNDQKVYSSAFSDFIEKLLVNTIKLEDKGKHLNFLNIDEELVKKVFENCFRYTIEIIQKSYYKDVRPNLTH
jgi:ubiquitin carboxyl-terminal hydrolase 34